MLLQMSGLPIPVVVTQSRTELKIYQQWPGYREQCVGAVRRVVRSYQANPVILPGYSTTKGQCRTLYGVDDSTGQVYHGHSFLSFALAAG